MAIHHSVLRKYRKSAHLSQRELASLEQTDADKARGTLLYTAKPGLVVKFGPVPVDAVSFYSLTFPFSSHQFLFSACRAAEVSIYDADADWMAPDVDGKPTKVLDGKGKPDTRHKPLFTTVVKVADPHFIEMVEMPIKGNIAIASQCGTSVASQPAKTDSDVDITKALLVNGQTILKAFKAGANSQSSNKN